MAKKSYAIAKPLKGPPVPREWWNYKKSGACPIVIERKLKYVVTHLDNLAKVEQQFAEEAAKAEVDRHPAALENLAIRIKNKQAWLDYSVQVLRNCVRFALARIEPHSEDHKLLKELRAEAGRPYKYGKIGRTNKRFHEKLRFYAKVLDQYLLAKTAASGTSHANTAMKEVWKMCSGAIANYRNKSGRERDDADQQAALGILKACKQYQPGKDGKLAQLTTFASFKIWRATQTRKASHCRPGQTIVKGKTKSVASVDVPSDGEGRSDGFHPSADTVDQAVVHDVRSALAQLPDDLREIAESGLLYGKKAREISEETGLTEVQVRSRLKKAKGILADLLSAHRED